MPAGRFEFEAALPSRPAPDSRGSPTRTNASNASARSHIQGIICIQPEHPQKDNLASQGFDFFVVTHHPSALLDMVDQRRPLEPNFDGARQRQNGPHREADSHPKWN